MAKRTLSNAPEPPKRSSLQMPRTEAEARLTAQITKGKNLLDAEITSEEELTQAHQDFSKWADYTTTLLRRIIDTDELANAFTPSIGFGSFGDEPLLDQIYHFKRWDVQDRLTRLESILEQLELI